MSLGNEIMRTIMQAATQQAESYAANICIGKVTSTSPLKIKIQNGLELTSDFLTLTSHCKETWINIPKHDDYEHVHDEDTELGFVLSAMVDLKELLGVVVPVGFVKVPAPPQGEEPQIPEEPETTKTVDFTHKHTIHKALPKILLWRGLQDGDDVILLKLPPYNFIVLERLEGITNDPKEGL